MKRSGSCAGRASSRLRTCQEVRLIDERAVTAGPADGGKTYVLE